MARKDCTCIICQVGHATNNQRVDVSEFITQIMYKKSNNDESICQVCYSLIRSGEIHECSPKKDHISNLQQCIPQKVQEQLSSKVLKDKLEASGSRDTKLSTHGTPLNVSIGTKRKSGSVNDRSFSHEDVISMKKHIGLSDRQTLKLAQDIRG